MSCLMADTCIDSDGNLRNNESSDLVGTSMTYDNVGKNCVLRRHPTDGHSGLTPDWFCQHVNGFLCLVMPSAVCDYVQAKF